MSDDFTSMQPLPWHEPLWQQVVATRRAGRMAHGLLVCGAPGTGIRRFGARLAQALLCHASLDTGDACGACPGCRQWQAESHPDVSLLTPEEPSGVIKVDRVRAFTYQLQLTPQYDSGRLGWIEPAERLNTAAANSLLKTLEEPPAGTHLILVTSHIGRLLPTIRSRCRIVRVPPAPRDMARQWLDEQGLAVDGMDDDALRMPLHRLARGIDADDMEAEWQDQLIRLLSGRMGAVALAERWNKHPPEQLIEWLYRTLCAMQAFRLTDSRRLDGPLAEVARGMEGARLQGLCAGAARACYLKNTNTDWQLVLESVLSGGNSARGHV